MMTAIHIERALKAGDGNALGTHLDELARLLSVEAERMKSHAPQVTAILHDASRALAIVAAAINPPANSRVWQLKLKRNGPGKPPDQLQIANWNAWSRARALEREMKKEGKRYLAFENLKKKYGISKSDARRAEKRVKDWIANQDKADGVEIPFIATRVTST